MPAGAIIGAAGSVAGGIAGGKGAKKAAKAQAKAKAAELAQQKAIFDQISGSYAPEVASGNNAASRVDQLLGLSATPVDQTELLRSQPGYQYRMQQALAAVNAGAAQRGMYRSGAAMKALQDRAYNVADQGFNQYLGQVSDVANRGSNAKASIAGAGTNFANASNSITQNAANAQSNAALYQASNFQNALGGVLGSLGQAFPSSYNPAKNTMPAATDPALMLHFNKGF